jgi:hypothetical protein
VPGAMAGVLRQCAAALTIIAGNIGPDASFCLGVKVNPVELRSKLDGATRRERHEIVGR